MNRFWNKIRRSSLAKRGFIKVLITAMIVIGFLLPLKQVKAEGEDVMVIMMVSAEEGKVGDTVTITLSVTSDILTSMTMYLNYPSQIFKYTGGDFTEANGFISCKLDGPKQISGHFTAIAPGSARFYTSGTDAKDAMMNQLTVFHAGATVVIEGEEQSEDDTEETTEDQNKVATATIGDITYRFTKLGVGYLPQGFTEDVVQYLDWIVPTYVSPNKAVKLVALQDDNESIYIYMLDEKTGDLIPYTPFTSSEHRYVIQEKPENVKLPEGFTASTYDFGYGQKTVYEKQGLDNIVLVYAINLDGEVGLHYFNTADRTLFPYIAMEDNTSEPAGDPGEPTTGSQAGTPSRTAAKDEGFFNRQNLIIIAIAISSLFLVMSIVAVTLMIRNSKQQGTIEELEYEMYQMEKRQKSRGAKDGDDNGFVGYRKRKLMEMEAIDQSDDGMGDDPFPEGEEETRRSRKNEKTSRKNSDRKYDDRNYDDREYDDREYDGYDDGYYDEQGYYDGEYDDREYEPYDEGEPYEAEKPAPMGPPSSGETIEIVLEEAVDNNRSSHVPPAVDHKVDRVQEAMKKRPFGIDSAFEVVDEIPENAYVSDNGSGTLRSGQQSVDRAAKTHVKSDEPQKVALPSRDEEDEG